MKKWFHFSLDTNTQRSSLEVLATYGHRGIEAMTELLEFTLNNDLRDFGSNLIKQIIEREREREREREKLIISFWLKI